MYKMVKFGYPAPFDKFDIYNILIISSVKGINS